MVDCLTHWNLAHPTPPKPRLAHITTLHDLASALFDQKTFFNVTQLEQQQALDSRATAPDPQEEAEKGWKRLKYKLVGNPKLGLKHLPDAEQQDILDERLKVGSVCQERAHMFVTSRFSHALCHVGKWAAGLTQDSCKKES